MLISCISYWLQQHCKRYSATSYASKRHVPQFQIRGSDLLSWTWWNENLTSWAFWIWNTKNLLSCPDCACIPLGSFQQFPGPHLVERVLVVHLPDFHPPFSALRVSGFGRIRPYLAPNLKTVLTPLWIIYCFSWWLWPCPSYFGFTSSRFLGE